MLVCSTNLFYTKVISTTFFEVIKCVAFCVCIAKLLFLGWTGESCWGYLPINWMVNHNLSSEA